MGGNDDVQVNGATPRAWAAIQGGVRRRSPDRTGGPVVMAVEDRETKAIDHDAVHTAWNIHSTVLGWTRNVDNKASFVSAIEVAILLGILTLAAEQRQLSRLSGVWQLGLFWLGVAALITSVGLVLWVVSPHLRTPRIREEYQSNVIFFGHAKYWDPQDLAEFLGRDDILPMLSREITAASDIAWKKHRNLQFSIAGFVIGALLVGAAAGLTALSS